MALPALIAYVTTTFVPSDGKTTSNSSKSLVRSMPYSHGRVGFSEGEYEPVLVFGSVGLFDLNFCNQAPLFQISEERSLWSKL